MRLFKLAILAFVLALLTGAPRLFAQGRAVDVTVSDSTVGKNIKPATPVIILAALQLPVITTITPASGVRGTSFSVTMNGTDFEAGLTVNAGDGVTVSNVAVTNSTTVTANFAISNTASLGLHNVTVTTGAGTSPAKAFSVLPPPPTFTGITPATGSLGANVNVTLTGTNFVSGLTVNAGSDITVHGLSVLSSTMAIAVVTIAPTAALGARDFTVTTAGGTSGALSFTLTAPPPPTLTGISPAFGVLGSVVNVTLSGTNFISGLSVNAVDGIAVTSVGVVNSTTATAVLTIDAAATLGSRSVTVTTAGGTSGGTAFSIVAVSPSLTGISPAAGAQGAVVPVTFTGSAFAAGLSVDFIPGITVADVTVTNSTTARATFTIDAAATVGARDIRVTTSGGSSNILAFTILPPPPTLSAISPASGILGMAVFATLTGTNFYAPMSIAVGTDIAVTNVNIIDPATATATFTIGLGAAPGLQTSTITTPGGSSTAALFSVVPFAPTLTSLSPASVVQGSLDRSFLVTLTGTNLFEPTIEISGTGVKAPPNVFMTSPTTGTAIFTVEANAALGTRNVTLTTTGGTSAPIAFTVLPPTPTLSSITPAIGVRGSSANVTISGTNFSTGTTTLNSIAGITITNTVVVNAITLTATFAIDANATLGSRNVTVTTSQGTTNALTFTVADPFPDLAITSTHSGKFGVGFNEAYTVSVTNNGTRATSGTISVNDALPPGLTFVSGIGAGWSCSAAGQNITCTNATVLAAGASSSFTLAVAVGSTAAAAINHTVSVTSTGDLNAVNNSATDPTTVAPTPAPAFVFNPSPLVAGEQATVAVRILSTFPHDVTGTATLAFVPSALVPVDDPALQFATGGRTVTFTIPANATQARFGSAADPAPLGFQAGTVAGRLVFNGTFTAGTVQGSFSPPVGGSAPAISQDAPVIKSLTTSTQGGFAVSILLFSTLREVTQLDLRFNTTAKLKLSCGTAAGCSIDGNTMSLNVSAMFAAWYKSDTTYGSLNLLRLPLGFDGASLKGTVDVRLRNRLGFSNVVSFDLSSSNHFGQ